jgi:glc operon protein GlcG
MDNTQLGSVEIAVDKARSAALFRRPSKAFDDALAGGRTAILALRGALPIEGGVPIVSGGKIAGAIGASSGTAQDGQVAKAGADVIK